jgi:hypothetical protein
MDSLRSSTHTCDPIKTTRALKPTIMKKFSESQILKPQGDPTVILSALSSERRHAAAAGGDGCGGEAAARRRRGDGNGSGSGGEAEFGTLASAQQKIWQICPSPSICDVGT